MVRWGRYRRPSPLDAHPIPCGQRTIVLDECDAVALRDVLCHYHVVLGHVGTQLGLGGLRCGLRIVTCGQFVEQRLAAPLLFAGLGVIATISPLGEKRCATKTFNISIGDNRPGRYWAQKGSRPIRGPKLRARSAGATRCSVPSPHRSGDTTPAGYIVHTYVSDGIPLKQRRSRDAVSMCSTMAVHTVLTLPYITAVV